MMVKYESPAAAEEELEQLAALFRLLSDRTRLNLLLLLADGERNVTKLCEALKLPQPTVSHHLRKLTEAGLLEREQRGKWAYFSLRRDAVEKLAAVADLKGACC